MIGYSGDGKSLFFVTANSGGGSLSLAIFDAHTHKESGTLLIPFRGRQFFSSPDGSRLIFVDGGGAGASSRRNGGGVTVVDVRKKEVVARAPLTGTFMDEFWVMAAEAWALMPRREVKEAPILVE